jgi:hypothetical protein
MCTQLCDTNTSARLITLFGDTVDWGCVDRHPFVRRIQSASDVNCFGLRPENIDTTGVSCKTATSVSENDIFVGQYDF